MISEVLPILFDTGDLKETREGPLSRDKEMEKKRKMEKERERKERGRERDGKRERKKEREREREIDNMKSLLFGSLFN